MYIHKHTHTYTFSHMCTYLYAHADTYRYTHMHNTHTYWWNTNNSSSLTFYKQSCCGGQWKKTLHVIFTVGTWSKEAFGFVLNGDTFVVWGLDWSLDVAHCTWEHPSSFISVIFSIPRKAEPLSAGLHSAAHECMCIWLWINRVR